MRKSLLKFLSFILCFLLLGSFTAVTVTSEAESTNEVPNEEPEILEERDFTEIYPDQDFEEGVVLVCFKPGTYDLQYEFTKEDFPELDVSRVENISKLTNEKMLADIEVQETYIHIIKVYLQDESREGVIEALEKLSKRSTEDIKSAEPNYICELECFDTPTDPFYENLQAAFYNRMSFPTAWNTQTGSTSIKVAILDCGVFNHEDLTLAEGFTVYSTSTNGYPPAIHGTMVAGIIGANWNQIEVAGTNKDVTLIPVTLDWEYRNGRIYYNYHNDEYSIIFTRLNNEEVQIANLSIGGSGYSSTQESAIRNYFGLVVCAAGNEDRNTDSSPEYPACYDADNIINVMGTRVYSGVEKRKHYESSTDPAGSNYGSNSVDIAALWDAFTTSVGANNMSISGSMDGTSASAPYVAGAAALVWATRPELSALEVKQILMETADHLTDLEGKCVCEGRLNAGAAVTAALSYHKHIPKTLIGNFDGNTGQDIFESRALNGKRFLTLDQSSEISDLDNTIVALHKKTNDNFFGNDPVFTGDVNGDNYDDVIVQFVSNGKRAFLVYKGSSDGVFSTGIKTYTDNTHDLDQFPCVSFTGNFNNDSCTDFLVQYRAQDGTRKNLVYFGQPNGKFSTGIKTPSERTYVAGDPVFVADVNGDTYDDVIVDWIKNGKRQLLVYYSNGSGGFGTPVNYPTTNSEDSNYVSEYFVGDFNGDGYDDFLVHWSYSSGGYRNFILYPGSTSGLSGTGTKTSTESIFVADDPIMIGDVNGDGKDDVVVHWVSNGYRALNTYLGKADNHFTSALRTYTTSTHNPTAYPTRLLLTDYTGDGKDDLIAIWTGYSKVKRIYVYKGLSNGKFTQSRYSIRDNLMYYFNY